MKTDHALPTLAPHRSLMCAGQAQTRTSNSSECQIVSYTISQCHISVVNGSVRVTKATCRLGIPAGQAVARCCHNLEATHYLASPWQWGSVPTTFKDPSGHLAVWLCPSRLVANDTGRKRRHPASGNTSGIATVAWHSRGQVRGVIGARRNANSEFRAIKTRRHRYRLPPRSVTEWRSAKRVIRELGGRGHSTRWRSSSSDIFVLPMLAWSSGE